MPVLLVSCLRAEISGQGASASFGWSGRSEGRADGEVAARVGGGDYRTMQEPLADESQKLALDELCHVPAPLFWKVTIG